MIGLMAVHVVLEAHPWEVRTGAWCAGCALPSAVEAVLLVADPRTLKIVGRTRIHQCMDCGVTTQLPVSTTL